MKYTQYLQEHQELTRQIDFATKEVDAVRDKYDRATPEAQRDLEPELKESIDRLEAAKSNLSTLESQHPEQELQREYGGDAILDRSWQDHWENHSDPEIQERFITASEFYQAAGYSEEQALQHMKGINFHDEVEVVQIQPGEVLTQYRNPEHSQVGNYFTPESDRSMLGIEGESTISQNRVAEVYSVNQEIEALKSTSADLPNWRDNDELLYGGGTQYFVAEPDFASLSNVFDRTPANYDELIAEWSQDIKAGIATTNDDFTTIVNDATHSLYEKLTGESYEGTCQELGQTVAQEIGDRFGLEEQAKFEESYQNYVPEIELQQEQERSQEMSY